MHARSIWMAEPVLVRRWAGPGARGSRIAPLSSIILPFKFNKGWCSARGMAAARVGPQPSPPSCTVSEGLQIAGKCRVPADPAGPAGPAAPCSRGGWVRGPAVRPPHRLFSCGPARCPAGASLPGAI